MKPKTVGPGLLPSKPSYVNRLHGLTLGTLLAATLVMVKWGCVQEMRHTGCGVIAAQNDLEDKKP